MDENHVLFLLMLAVKESRVARTRVYDSPQILFCVVAMLSVATTFNEMELFAKWIALPGISRHDTFNRVLQLIEPQALEGLLKGGGRRMVGADLGRATTRCD